MKRSLFSFIRPCLSLLDNGKFYRKPIGWFYAFIAVFFLLTPILMVYSTVWWNHANQKKSEAQKLYQELVLPEYQSVKNSKDTLSQVVEGFGKEMNNAIDCLTKATKQADYYGEYASYGPEYKQIYTNALEVKRQWEVAYQDAADRWDAANAELEVLKSKFDRIKMRHDRALAVYNDATDEFDLVNQFGTAFMLNDMNGGYSIAALVLFSIMLILVGVLNFLLWWSRLLELKSLVKVQDRFVATPVASHFVQTMGESCGLTVGLWGFFTTLIYFTCHLPIGQLGMPFTKLGILGIFVPIVVGFLLSFVFRVMAELLKAVVALANNKGE